MLRENHSEMTALYRALIEQAHRLIADGQLDAAVLTLRDAVSFAPDRDEASRLMRGVLARM